MEPDKTNRMCTCIPSCGSNEAPPRLTFGAADETLDTYLLCNWVLIDQVFSVCPKKNCPIFVLSSLTIYSSILLRNGWSCDCFLQASSQPLCTMNDWEIAPKVESHSSSKVLGSLEKQLREFVLSTPPLYIAWAAIGWCRYKLCEFDGMKRYRDAIGRGSHHYPI